MGRSLDVLLLLVNTTNSQHFLSTFLESNKREEKKEGDPIRSSSRLLKLLFQPAALVSALPPAGYSPADFIQFKVRTPYGGMLTRA
jgi:hypothetical protein